MAYKLRMGTVLVIMLMCIAVFGGAVMRAFLVEPTPATFMVMIVTLAAGGFCLWDAGKALAKQVQDDSDAYWRDQWHRHAPHPQPRASGNIAMPGQIDARLQEFLDSLARFGTDVAGLIKAGTNLKDDMSLCAVHLDGVASENQRLQKEADKVRQIANIAAPETHDDGAPAPAFLTRRDPFEALEADLAQYFPKSRGEIDAGADGEGREEDPSPRPAA